MQARRRLATKSTRLRLAATRQPRMRAPPYQRAAASARRKSCANSWTRICKFVKPRIVAHRIPKWIEPQERRCKRCVGRCSERVLQQRHGAIKIAKQRVSARDRFLLTRKPPSVFFDTLQNRPGVGFHLVAMTKLRIDLYQSASKEKTVVASGPERFEFLLRLNK